MVHLGDISVVAKALSAEVAVGFGVSVAAHEYIIQTLVRRTFPHLGDALVVLFLFHL